jgi:hypothetical protein
MIPSLVESQQFIAPEKCTIPEHIKGGYTLVTLPQHRIVAVWTGLVTA